MEDPELSELSITPEFYNLLKKYTQSNDPLEDPNFDIAAYLNEKFPDFKSLDKLPNLIDDFEREIGELDEEIDSLMCERAKYNDEMKNYMNELDNDVSKIIELINSIKANTDTNETTVKMICNDIKNLDNARNNITTTISSLTKLIMLITGIEKLELFVKEKQYKEAANAIAASNDIMEYFKEYRHVTQVNTLYQKKDTLCSKLLASILDEFKANIEILPNNSDRLYEACLAINAIGDNAIRSLKTWFTQYKLTPYETLYDPRSENTYEFSETSRRFTWLKTCLQDYDNLYDEIFPPSWGFKSQLCQEFCRITKLHLNDILMMNLEGVKKIEVDDLVKVLNDTINFEKDLHSYLLNHFPSSSLQTEKSNQDTGNVINDIKNKYAGIKERNPNRKDPNETPKFQPFRVIGVISESFEPYMQSYVNNEEIKIKETIKGLKEKDRIEGKLYVSSLHLFNNIKQAMNRCLTFSKSKTFYDLCLRFKEIFKFYNETILKSKFSMNILQNNNSQSLIILKENDIKAISYVINTSDYCITTIEALTLSLKEKIEEKYANSISYNDIIDSLKEIYKCAYDVLSQNIKNMIMEQLKCGFLKMNWVAGNSMNNAVEVSSFIIKISKAIESNFLIVKDILQEVFICHFLNIIPKLVTETMIMYLYKLKKIDEAGAQKLLADVYELKAMILNIYYLVVKPVPGQNKEIDSRYNCLNMISRKEFGKIESRLKCLGSIVGEIGNAYKNFVENKSKEDFDKLISVRGIKKSEIIDYEKIFI